MESPSPSGLRELLYLMLMGRKVESPSYSGLMEPGAVMLKRTV